MGKTKKKKKSLLIAKGGQGCIFKPEIPCKNKTKNFKPKSGTLSKISFRPESSTYEFEMNEYVRKIKNHDEWAVLWDKKCKTPAYSTLSEFSEIDKCIEKENIKRKKKQKSDLSKHTQYEMLIGPYSGQPAADIFSKEFNHKIYSQQKLFNQAIHKLFKYMKPLFEGIIELDKHKIFHNDLNDRNMIYKNKQFYMIDFGLASKYSNISGIKKRMKFIFETDKIYESYPWDYTLYSSTFNQKYKTLLKQEYNDYKQNFIMRDEGDEINDIYLCMGIHNIHDLLLSLMNDFIHNKYKPTCKDIISKMDVYSLGILLPTMIYRYGLIHGKTVNEIQKLCSHKELNEIFDLLHQMTQLKSTERITPSEAYKIYQEI